MAIGIYYSVSVFVFVCVQYYSLSRH